MTNRIASAVLCLALAAPAAQAQERRDPRVSALVQRIEAARLSATVGKLVSFGTRHTLSETASATRGIGAARAWLASELAALARAPGSRLKAFEDRFTAPPGKRIPAPAELLNLGVVLPGTDPARARQALVMTGHYDSIPSDVMDPKTDAPGANDDGSGTSMVLELARVFAAEKPAIAIYFVAVAGEEQGLVGSQHLAERLKAEGVEVLAMASVDIAGNSEGMDGIRDSATGRLFSEGVPAVESDEQKKLREAVGGENDGPAREWARYVARVGERYVDGLRLRVLLRRDRIARGSDHMSFARTGVPALRLSESRENYRRQHQTPRVENGLKYGDDLEHFDAPYAARLCKALGAALAALSAAPSAPQRFVQGGAVSPDTKLRWTLPADPRIADVVLYRRPAETVRWERMTSLGKVSDVVLPSVVPDDFFFAVATADAAGNESLPQAPTELGR
ncbi:MAG: M20/M25/M40 family metallo-hydrolase [Myxococcales bacterium]